MFNENNKIIFIILSIALLGGLQPIIFSRIINYNIPKKQILLYVGMINILFVGFYIYFFDKEIQHQHKPHNHCDKVHLIILFIIYTLICITIPNLLYTYNMHKEIVISHNSLLYISPLFTLLIAYFIFNKDITLKQFLGAGLIFGGAYFICD
jgi:drug/metabolite transporter (DMT)-like permease